MCFVNSICQVWQRYFGDTFASGLGLAAALLALVLVLYIVLRLCWWMIFRHRRVSQIVMRGKTGDIVIAEPAILDSIRSISGEFPELDFGRIRINRRGSGYGVELKVEYHTGSRALGDCCDAVRTRINEVLFERFQIGSFKRVDVRLERLSAHQ